MTEVSRGSSPIYSKFRPPTDNRWILAPGPSRMSTPRARHSSARLCAISAASAGFHVEASGSMPGKEVLLSFTSVVCRRMPCDASAIETGRTPRRGMPAIMKRFQPPVSRSFSSKFMRRIRSAARSEAGNDGSA